MPGFDWPAMMRAAFQGLRLRPDEFWALTPAEFLMMLGIDGGSPALTRDRLAELSEKYPDSQKVRTEND